MGIPRVWKPKRGPSSHPRPTRQAFNTNTAISTTPDGTVRVIVRQRPRPPQVWNEPDELAGTVATIGVEVDGPPDLRRVPSPAPQHPNFANDEDQAAFGGLRIDEDYQWAAQYLQLVANRQLFLDTEELAPLISNIGVEENEYRPTQYVPLLPNRQPITDTEELSTSSATQSATGAPRVVVRATPRQQQIWNVPDELGVAAAAPALDEEIDALRLIGQPVLPRPRFCIGHEELAPRGIDEDEWTHPRPVELVRNRQPILDTEELPLSGATIGVEVDGPPDLRWVPSPARQHPNFANDEDQAAFGGLRIDEDYQWAAQYLQLVANRQPILDTEEPGLLGGLRIDEDYYWTAQGCAVLHSRQPRLEGHDSWDTPSGVLPYNVVIVRLAVPPIGSLPTAQFVTGTAPSVSGAVGSLPTGRDVEGMG